jgi:hypothetical protein
LYVFWDSTIVYTIKDIKICNTYKFFSYVTKNYRQSVNFRVKTPQP